MSKKFVIIPDSFKGTLSSIEVCDIIENEILNVFNDAEIKKIPVADGGEGSVDAFLEGLKGEKVFVEVNDPFFQKMTSFYGLIDQGETAVIEMAACAGLPLVGNKKDPRITTTYGVGELLLHAIEHGVNKVILGIGGSSTNDGGCGFAAALGVKFYDQNHETFIPTGGTLHQIHQIDKSNLDKRLNQIELITMCDIDNPLYGKEGAAYVFGPQKGADPEMVEFLDQGLKHLAKTVHQSLGIDDPYFKGAGAAGGLGYGAKIFANSKIQMGIETVLDAMQFDELAKDADYIITGEGQMDFQSLRGKVAIGVARRAKRTKAKVIAVVGSLKGNKEDYINEGIDDIIVTNYLNLSFDELKPRAKEDMTYTVGLFIGTLK
ncbi:MAG: glycerate kinase [Acholeplasmataceae bacterium]|jgi:glycerate kinase|nr:glycerate kinase [Acholeplasmataceae bacterium]